MSYRPPHPVLGLLAFAVAGVLCLPANAGVITAPGSTVLPGSSTGQIGPFANSPLPNNDGSATPSPNQINYQLFVNSLGRIEVEFVVAHSGGVTEYSIGQVLFNLTLRPWSGFDFELGFGIGTDFVRSTTADGLGFDVDSPAPPAGSPAFANVAEDLDTLSFNGGLVQGPAPLLMTFTIDVPDSLAAWNPSGQNRFTLRQSPVVTAVPEPATALLLLSGVGLLLWRRRLA